MSEEDYPKSVDDYIEPVLDSIEDATLGDKSEEDISREKDVKQRDLESEITGIQDSREELEEEYQLTGDSSLVEPGQLAGKAQLDAEIEKGDLDAQDTLSTEDD